MLTDADDLMTLRNFISCRNCFSPYQAAEAAARDAQLESLSREVREGVARQAWPRFAAMRIARAWRAYRDGAARRDRVRGITTLQAAVRAHAARRLHRQLAARREAMRRLEEAAGRGQLEAAREALEMARSVGLGGEALARVSAMEGQAKEASDRLTAAAATGTYAAFRSAMDAASKFSHLAQLVAESTRAFAARRSEAEAEVRAAVEGRPLPEVARAVEAATLLGGDAASASEAVAAARRRDAEAVAALQAFLQRAQGGAAEAFDQAAFQAAAERCLALGLRGDVAAARHAVERRRAAAALDFQRRSAAGASASEMEAMVSEALALGMDSEAQAMRGQLEHRRGELSAALTRAADAGDAAEFERLAARPAHEGRGANARAAARAARDGSRGRAVAALRQRAEAGSLTDFRRASAAALRCGCSSEAEAMLRVVDERRADAAARLARALEDQWLQRGRGAEGAVVAMMSALESRRPGASIKQGGASSSEGLSSASSAAELVRAAGVTDVLTAAAVAALWSALSACSSLGLSFNAGLALSAAALHCRVSDATAAVTVAAADVARGFFGEPLALPDWDSLQHDSSVTSSDAVVGPGLKHARESHCQTDGGREGATVLSWALASGRSAQELGDLYWRLASPTAADKDGQAHSHFPAGAGKAPVQEAAPPEPAPARRPPLPPRQARRTEPPQGGKPLSLPLVASLSSVGSLSREPGSAAAVSATKLDLGLERLTCLAGVERWAPALRVLLANSNHLASFEDLSGLERLEELSLKDNYLLAASSQAPSAAPTGAPRPSHGSAAAAAACWSLPPSLRKLWLDSNGLRCVPRFAAPLPELRTLCLSQNELAGLDSGSLLAAPTLGLAALAPRLASLDLSGNRLTSLSGLGSLPCLTELDVSFNLLSSLDGLELCPALIHVDATANQVGGAGLSWLSSPVSCQLSLVSLFHY